MDLLEKIVDYFGEHPGYELLMSFVALVFSTIPYIWGAFKKTISFKSDTDCF